MRDFLSQRLADPHPAGLRQALEALPVMAFFAIAGKAEATRGAGRWSLDNEKTHSFG
ncbi:hypothetical protein [Planococcus sp. NCCP-2050]|uniref:hypothetical protein n=1 Tax=Planococcus sp. NCCP-2050 TaxID=2944679 RepID=UPI0020417B30|nr:hypothetical protein [Planococcus sp. NCCP-2050]GKW45468.1 hypothetical protein NCCP2050_11600 [Planococcus sp. NCCP-2050]